MDDMHMYIPNYKKKTKYPFFVDRNVATIFKRQKRLNLTLKIKPLCDVCLCLVKVIKFCWQETQQ